MMDRVIEETASRGKAENDKATIEQELAELSSSLFAEANSMVASERVLRLRSERKMEYLERNLKDTEALMLSQSGQMRDLGGQVDDLEKEREELRKQIETLEEESLANQNRLSVDPSEKSATESDTNGVSPDGQANSIALPGSAVGPSTPGGNHKQLASYIAIAHPLQFLSYEVLPFHEFVVFTKSMARIRKNILTRPYDPNDGYNSGYHGAYGGSAHADRPSQAYLERMHAQEQREAIHNATLLSQYLNFSFMKRLAEEDSDPTLRLDQAPGLTFFSKRNIPAAIVDGKMLIEPAYASLPSDKCSLCGTSLERYIASHQTTIAKEDPRKKLTRLATGWMPGSGTSTPTKEKDQPSWSISALSDALQGALTPSKEASGFNFGNFATSGSQAATHGFNVPNSGSASSPARPKSANGLTPKERTQNLPTTGSVNKSGEPEMGNFPLIPSARAHAQVYLFRTVDSETRYALCPTYCLPRLRAVCELWTYIRSIQKGLITEDNPKFYAGGARSDTSEYTQHVRKLVSKLPPGAAGGIKGIKTPLMTPQALGTPSFGDSKQLGAEPIPSTNGSGDTGSTSGLGLSIGKKDFAYDPSNSESTESLNSNKSSSIAASSSGEGVSTDATTPAVSSASTNASVEGLSKDARVAGNSSAPSSRRQSLDNPDQSPLPGTPLAGPGTGEFKLTLPPTRPKRNVMRENTPTGSTVSSPMMSNVSAENSPATPSTANSVSEGTPAAPAVASAEQADPVPAFPGVSAMPSEAVVPPAMPARAQSSTATASNPASMMQPPRLPNRPTLSRLASSSTNGPGQGRPSSPGRTLSRKASIEKGLVSTAHPEWQAKCWFEIVRLREVVL